MYYLYVIIICCRFKYSVLVLTFITYVAYHASRKPFSVVKNVLHQKNCSVIENPKSCNWAPFGKLY